VQWLIMVGAQLSERIRAAVKACGRTLEKMTKYERHTIVTVSQSPRQVVCFARARSFAHPALTYMDVVDPL